ncbi:MAG: GpE family phage tail protein [Methylococcaceae bacterium]|nr:GpE family phage tail protein [Methylococcaceae bacterium]
MRAEIAFVFHFQPSELDALDLHDFLEWHRQALRLNG